MELYHCGNQWGYTPLGNTANIPTGFCNPPTGLKAVATNQHVFFSWVAPHDYLSFILEYSLAADFSGLTAVEVFGTSHQLPLLGKSTYYWRVRTKCSGILSSTNATPADQVTTGTPIVGCVAVNPATIVFTNMGTYYKAAWSGTGAAFYRVFICLDIVARGIDRPCEFSLDTQDTFIDLPPLTAGQTYQVTVQAFCNDGTITPLPDPVPITIQPLNCPAPVKLSAIKGATSITISWFSGGQIGSAPATYNIYLDGELVAVNFTLTSFTFTGLTPNTEYLIEVRQNCKNSFSVSTPLTIQTNNSPCNCLIDTFTTSNQTDTGIRLNWTSSCLIGSTIDHYELTIGNSAPIILAANILFYDLANLPSGSIIKAQIKVVCATGQSNTATLETTITLTGCGAPTGLAVSYLNGNIIVTWNAVSNAQHYLLNIEGPVDIQLTLIGSPYTLLNAIPGAAYTFTLTAVCMIGGVPVVSGPAVIIGTYPIAPCLQYVITETRYIEPTIGYVDFKEDGIHPYTGAARIVVKHPDTSVIRDFVVAGAGAYKFDGLIGGLTYQIVVYDVPASQLEALTAELPALPNCTPTPTPYPHAICWLPVSPVLTFLGPTTLQLSLPGAAWTAAQTGAYVSLALATETPGYEVFGAPVFVAKADFPYNFTVAGYGRYVAKVVALCNGKEMQEVISGYSCPPVTLVARTVRGGVLTLIMTPALLGYHQYKITILAIGMVEKIYYRSGSNIVIDDLEPNRFYKVKVEVVCSSDPEVLSAPIDIVILTGGTVTPQECEAPVFSVNQQNCSVTVPETGNPDPENPSACEVTGREWTLINYFIIPLATDPDNSLFFEALFMINQDPLLLEETLIPGGVMGVIDSLGCRPTTSTPLSLTAVSGSSNELAEGATLAVNGNITGTGTYTPNGAPALYVRVRGSYIKAEAV